MSIFKGKTPGQFFKYLISGTLAFMLEYSSFYILNKLGLWYVYSNSMAMVLGFFLSFFLNRNWSFKSQKNTLKQILMYGILFIINMGISNGLMFIFIEKLYILPPLAKLMAIGILVLWNFIIYKKVIFK